VPVPGEPPTSDTRATRAQVPEDPKRPHRRATISDSSGNRRIAAVSSPVKLASRIQRSISQLRGARASPSTCRTQAARPVDFSPRRPEHAAPGRSITIASRHGYRSHRAVVGPNVKLDLGLLMGAESRPWGAR
jgi:hypothetical protein